MRDELIMMMMMIEEYIYIVVENTKGMPGIINKEAKVREEWRVVANKEYWLIN